MRGSWSIFNIIICILVLLWLTKGYAADIPNVIPKPQQCVIVSNDGKSITVPLEDLKITKNFTLVTVHNVDFYISNRLISFINCNRNYK